MTYDNRIRLPSAKIDFTDVGLSGQDHDNYPPPQGQARFDHMRMVIIGLLSQQSSLTEPSQYRDGTPWFDLNTFTLKIRVGDSWVSYADCVSVAEDATGEVTTLTEWYNSVSTALSSLTSEVIFSGTCNANSIALIDVPLSLQEYVLDDSRPIVYINGLLIDPRNTTFSSAATIRLTNTVLDSGDTFTVFIRRVPTTTFYAPTVSVP